jgi:acyl-CoA synthetase (AMP-forming)/AMP-acid ligase II
MNTLQERFRGVGQSHPSLRSIYWGPEGASTHLLGDIRARAARVAAALAARGLHAGDRVVVQLANCSENLVMFQAALELGLVFVPVPQIYGRNECEFILNHSKAKAMIVPRRWRSVDMVERMSDLLRTTKLERVVIVGEDAPHDERFLAWEALESGSAAVPPVSAAQPGDICCVLYTSGTTANPKPAMHSHASLCALMEGLLGNMQGPYSPNYLQCFPAGHMGGLIAMMWGVFGHCDTVFMERWDASAAVSLIHEHRVGIGFGGPFFLRGLLDNCGERGLGPLKFFSVGGASVPPSLIVDAQAAGVSAARAYGSTEHPMLTIGVYSDSVEDRVSTDGRCVNGNEYRLVDESGADVPPGEAGEVITRGPSRFAGYDDASLNADSFTKDGWFLTGDIGVADGRGFLKIVDRKKDIIIRGGENISSMEVEAILSRHPSVQDAAVVAWPDAVMGEKVAAFVELKAGCTLSLDDVTAHFNAAGVARQKFPEHVLVIDALPRSATSKVLKAELRRRVKKAAKEAMAAAPTKEMQA